MGYHAFPYGTHWTDKQTVHKGEEFQLRVIVCAVLLYDPFNLVPSENCPGVLGGAAIVTDTSEGVPWGFPALS